ncbi:SusC/RagA family TonB-linked outer membrane protein [Chryseolinea sp. H1M3-3]|uniref:SusC/RagA family TonB-linked outer membrane protein n=1 Tax=Chryseolinea sp. H1M3-3 TaxID=3034144 RepID=UPI0023EC2D89|nr:SusC/RagA family TonB-linked outer membrane protein [Chryseolinea sp. H1M3-3]
MIKSITKLKHVLRLTLLLSMLTAMQGAFAQHNVTGTVLSVDGESLPGANVVLKGSTQGTISDANGKFEITVPGPQAILVISFVGYTNTEIPVGDQTNITVNLTPDIASLQEVVVIGYGTQRAQDVTTAVSSVKPKEFVPGAVRNVGELLRGKVAGLSIGTPTGDPNEDAQFLLRGITSLLGSSEPLVLIDGFTGDLNSISPSDIESVDVLKDASASAIYGTRGKNGVILITTKKAKGEMKPVVEYSGYVSTDRFLKKADFMDANEVRSQIAAGNIEPAYDLGGNTDWLDEITRNPINHFHNVSLRGGTGRSTYVINTSYQKAEGMFLKSDNEELKLRLDLGHYLVKDKLKLNVNVLKGIQHIGSFDRDIYRQALIRNPTDNVKNNNGEWVEHTDQFQYENPVSRIKEQITDNKQDWTWLTTSLSYYPIEDLELKIAGSQHDWREDIGWYQSKKHISALRGKNGVAYVSNAEQTEKFLDLTADYSKTIDKHRISALLGYSYLDYYYSRNTITNFNFPTDEFSYHAIHLGQALAQGLNGSGVNIDKNATSDMWPNYSKLIAFFGRVGYGFDDKYNILASLRYEGSSKFGANNRWGLFPSVSVGWTLSNESFLADADFVSNLKLRAGFGKTGSTPNDPYQSLVRYRYDAGNYYFNGEDWVYILAPVGNANPDLGWETNTEYNIGVDYGFLQNRIYGAIDYYDRRLEDLLYNYPVPVPPNLVGTTLANAASMVNKGLEISLSLVPVTTSKIEWVSSINYSRNTNKLSSLSSSEFKLANDFLFEGYTGDPIQMSTHKLETGRPMGSFFGYKSVGITEDGIWLIENSKGEQKPITDVTEDDRQILGNGLPKWYLAWNNTFRYGNFDLNVTMRGAFDYQILNTQRMFYENPTIVYNRLNSAFNTIDGKVLTSPQSYVSAYVEDGDFWKIDNVTLGYNFNASKVKQFAAARVYVSASNLATFTDYKGIDPEVNRAGLAPGVDERDKYPTVRSFTLGVNLTF